MLDMLNTITIENKLEFHIDVIPVVYILNKTKTEIASSPTHMYEENSS